ncbi:MAG: RraA family protein [Chloroflexi bacterium]|nr:RraA family protein [Chloroflexota bacterium]
MTKSVSAQVLDALREFDSPTISNAIEHFKVRDPVTGYASLELRCQFPELKPMVGYAVTCTADTTTAGDHRPMRVHDLLDAVQASPKPAVVVVKHVGPDRLRTAFVGDMICTALQKLGAVGVVTDGGNRDASGIRRRAPGFQLFAPGWVVSHGYGVYMDFNVTVSVCGLTIQPGDLLHGDESGLLTIPLDIAEPAVVQATAVREAEAEYFEYLQSSSFTYEGLKSRIGRH